ncbi:MAG TPA: O-antigen ligase family protein [Candidatus Binataceae bacterium]|nr:O-antigen ligase family protein [Candidatus Binataceae bacterium]
MGRRRLDRAVIAGLVFLIGFPPLAFGAVHRGPLIVVEAVSFALLVLWMANIYLDGVWRVSVSAAAVARPDEVRRIALPALALTLLLAGELAPLPPPLMRLAAPATYQLYRVSLPGWPSVSLLPIVAPDRELAAAGQKAPDVASSLALAGARAAFPPGVIGERWRALAISPAAAASALLEWLALASTFFVVVLYPFGFVGERNAEVRFYRSMIVSLLLTATAVALIGLGERAWWNGKLLWFYVPSDWGGASVTNPRASGPFVDPDHFANYLAMVLPLAVVGAIYPFKIFPRPDRGNLQLFAALGTLVIAGAILLSLSRAGWVAAIAGVGIGLALCVRHAWSLTPIAIRKLGPRAAGVLTLLAVISLVVLLLAAGPATRMAAANRVGSVIAAGDDVRYRPAVWRDTLGILCDFSWFGVGLAGWPELFPHYERAPWMPFFFREAENDYLQFAAETGIVGVLVTLWLGIALAGVIRRGAARLAESEWPLFAALAGGIVATLIHEGFDFSLHTPANAVLFTILLALSVRIALVDGAPREGAIVRVAARSTRLTYVGAAAGALAACGLICAVYLQAGGSYPYDITARRGLAYAARNLTAHPAMASAHLALVAALGREAAAELRLAELRIAVWLDPNDPAARDQYAQGLLQAGNRAAGLAQIATAVNRAPMMLEHYYLAASLIPWLLPDEQAAVARGFTRAIDDGYPGAVGELAAFYRDLGRTRDVGALYEQAALRTADADQRMEDLIKAGTNYGIAGDAAAAIRNLRAAAEIDHADARPYAELARSVYGPEGKLTEANAAVEEGMRNGADRFDLDVALADAAEQSSDPRAAESALEAALRERSSFALTMRLGGLYLANGDFAPAVLSFGRATALEPDSAAAWFALGEAHERDYDYIAASDAYARAHRLDPANRAYARTAADLAERISRENAPVTGAPDGTASIRR